MAKKETKVEKVTDFENLDHYLDYLHKTNAPDIDNALEEWDEFNKDENINHLINNLFTPAQDQLYQTFVKKMGKDDDTAKLSDKKDEMKSALVESLKAYFGKVHPSVTKSDSFKKVIGDMSLDEQFEYMGQLYDSHVGAQKGRFKAVFESSAKRGKTIGDYKILLSQNRIQHADHGVQVMKGRLQGHLFSKYHGPELAGRLISDFNQMGHTIDDHVTYGTLDTGRLLHVRDGIKKGNVTDLEGNKSSPEAYGLKMKEKTYEKK